MVPKRIIGLIAAGLLIVTSCSSENNNSYSTRTYSNSTANSSQSVTSSSSGDSLPGNSSSFDYSSTSSTSFPKSSSSENSNSEGESSSVPDPEPVITKKVYVKNNLYSKLKQEDNSDTYEIPVENPEEGRIDCTFSIVRNGYKKILENTADISVEGDYVDLEYLNHQAFFINRSGLTITFKKAITDATVVDQDGYEYAEYDDEKTESLLGNKVGIVHRGALIILKSFNNGETWTYENASYVDVGDDAITYTPKGEDIDKGVLYRFFYGFKMKTQRKIGVHTEWTPFWPFNPHDVDTMVDFYATIMHESIFYVGNNVIGAGFYSEDIKYEAELPEGVEAKVVNRIISLTDGSITFGDVTYKNNGQISLVCRYRYNDGDIQYASDGQVFNVRGKYEFTVSNVIGTSKLLTIYLVDKDTLFTSYFTNDGPYPKLRRIFDPASTVPVYMNETQMVFNNNPYLPPISGYVYKAVDNTIGNEPYLKINKDVLEKGLVLDPGAYLFKLTVGGQGKSVGQKIVYTMSLIIANRPDYKPMVNNNLLKSSSRKSNLSLVSYATQFRTTKGGSYVFLFPLTLDGYEQASNFAFDIEKRFVQEYKDDKGQPYYYYRGTRYDSKIDLYSKIIDVLKDSVYVSYIDPSETYAVDIIDKKDLENIEDKVLDHDVRVCIDETTRDSLMTQDIIINGFSFTQIRDFESSSLHIKGEGIDQSFDYEVQVDTLLTNSGKYTITEKNWNGEQVYNVNYIAPGENTGVLNISLLKDGVKTPCSLDQKANSTKYECDLIEFGQSGDELDSQCLLIVSAPSIGYRETCLLDEAFVDIPHIYAKGTYNIKVINRLGSQYEFEVEVSGDYNPEEEEVEDYEEE